MVEPEVPARRRDGRPGPLAGYPKDPDLYADPRNWKYPVHTPFHAGAARRYFNAPANRRKYTAAEQAYVDGKIDEALRRFGIAAPPATGDDEAEAGVVLPEGQHLEDLDRDGLLLVLLGKGRLERARGIDLSSVLVAERSPERILAKVKDYDVLVDRAGRRVVHDCPDWRRGRARAKLLCKHVGRLVLYLPEAEARELLRDVLSRREAWTFATGG